MIQLLTNSLLDLSHKHTQEILGDRSEYIGASELGQCPRKIVLNKLDSTEPDLATLLRFKRGHMAEDLVAEALAENGKFKPQREVEVSTDDPVPLKAHIDFLFEGKALGVLEVKSVTSIPDSPYESWEMQLHAQMGLLALNEPGVQIKGAILAIDLLNGRMQLFNGYTPNGELFQGLLQKAQHIWDCLTNGAEPETEPGPLCAYCDNRADCPALDGEEVPEELVPIIKAFLEAREAKKKAEGTFRELQDKLLSVFGDRPFKAEGKVLKKVTRTSSRYDYKGISEALESVGKSLDEFRTCNTYTYLLIK